MPLRSTIVGAASGVVLLAGVVGFAVGLPEVAGDDLEAQADEGQAGSDTPPSDLLPETLLDGAVVRYSDVSADAAPVFDEVEGFSSESLTQTFGTDVAVGVYTTPDEQVRVAVTIYDGESGLFLQTGPPVPPEMSANSETTGEFLRDGDSACFAQWQTQAKAQGGPPFQTQCQRVADGRTINVYGAGGLTVEQTADLVDDVAAQAGLE